MDTEFLAASLLSQGCAVVALTALRCNAWYMQQQDNLKLMLPPLLAQKEWSGQLCTGRGHALRAQESEDKSRYFQM